MDSVKWEKLEDPSRSPKRKKHSSIACSHCRKLKIRCQGGNPAPPTQGASSQACEYCAQRNIDCHWPTEDGRKLKRQRSRSASQSSSGSGHAGFDRLVSLPFNEASTTSTPTQLPILEEYRAKDFKLAPSGQKPSLPRQQSNETQSSDTRLSSASDTPYTTVHYYRHHGPTALAPGHKQVSLKARHDDHEYSHAGQMIQPHPGERQLVAGSYEAQLFDDVTGLPNQTILPSLLDTFFKYYGGLYCFINQRHLSHLLNSGKPPTFLVVVISALSSRFCDPELFRPFFPPLAKSAIRESWEYSTPFLEKAKSMVITAINLPSTDGIAALLLLSFADFGENNEAGKSIAQ